MARPPDGCGDPFLLQFRNHHEAKERQAFMNFMLFMVHSTEAAMRYHITLPLSPAPNLPVRSDSAWR